MRFLDVFEAQNITSKCSAESEENDDDAALRCRDTEKSCELYFIT